ncbi:MAG TPA: sensor histidine kinase [Micromonospora sp.]|nr:sensor histidine kinase [Micromonospora sp.]
MTPRPLHWLRGWPLAADGLLAAALVVLDIVVTALLPRELWPDDIARAVSLSVLSALPVTLRRIAPRAAVAAALLTLAAALAASHYPLAQALMFMVLTYSVAAAWPMRPAVLAAAILWIPVMAANTLIPASDTMQQSPAFLIVNNLLVALVTFFFGRTVHGHRASNQALRERARTAEENLRTLAEQAVAAERQRIARELHDVVAHHVVVMGVLATGARRMLHRNPDAADEALGTIEDTSRTTIREMRRLLDVLRTDAEPAALDLAPQPGLAGIEALVDQVREAGLPVSLKIDGEIVDLDSGVALTVFRIVQEALTNTLKHARPTTAEVRLDFGRHRLEVEILDDGRGPAPQPAQLGHGLVGMRERVALYGGLLQTGSRPGGGFRVYAEIPREQLGTPNGEVAA